MSPSEKTGGNYPAGVFGRDEVLQLLGEMLSQAKPGHLHHPPPLSKAAQEAIEAHRRNLRTLGTDTRSTASSPSIK